MPSSPLGAAVLVDMIILNPELVYLTTLDRDESASFYTPFSGAFPRGAGPTQAVRLCHTICEDPCGTAALGGEVLFYVRTGAACCPRQRGVRVSAQAPCRP